MMTPEQENNILDCSSMHDHTRQTTLSLFSLEVVIIVQDTKNKKKIKLPVY